MSRRRLPGVIPAKRRTPHLAAYMQPINDGSTGVFRNLMTNVDATLTGGSTLTDQAKFRNDFQHAGQLIPGQCLYRAAPAWTNLLYERNTDSPSFENGTAGRWGPYGGSTVTVDSSMAFHGTKSLRCTGGNVAGANNWIEVETSPDQTYTAALMVEGGNMTGSIADIFLWDNVSGATSSTTQTLEAGVWKLLTVTKTFDPDSTQRALYFRGKKAGGANPTDYCRIDAAILVSGSTIPVFTEAECTATSCTFPTPFSAGEPVSFLVVVWTPWGYGEASDRYIIDTWTSGNSRIRLFFWGGTSKIWFYVTDASGGAKYSNHLVDSSSWPAGSVHGIAVSRDGMGTQIAAIDGTLFGTLSQGSGTGLEGSLPATIKIGMRGDGASHFNGLLLGPYIYRGVAWDDAMCQKMSSLQAPPPRMRMVG